MGKVYLGDSVYADFNAIIRGDVILTTETGNGPTNSIYLDPQVIDALNKRRTSLEHNTRATPSVTALAKCEKCGHDYRFSLEGKGICTSRKIQDDISTGRCGCRCEFASAVTGAASEEKE